MSGERLISGSSGWMMLTVCLTTILGGLAIFVFALVDERGWLVVAGLLVALVGTFLFAVSS